MTTNPPYVSDYCAYQTASDLIPSRQYFEQQFSDDQIRTIVARRVLPEIKDEVRTMNRKRLFVLWMEIVRQDNCDRRHNRP